MTYSKVTVILNDVKSINQLIKGGLSKASQTFVSEFYFFFFL